MAQILAECGYEVEVQKNVQLARGDVNVDVWADDHSSPQNIIVVECKNWAKPATKNVVHAFRAVVGDSGANTGLIVSAAGFQDGAVEAAAYSNVRLLDWDEFQDMFAARWFKRYFSTTLAEESDALHEYTEPFNTRIFNKADILPSDRRERFKALRKQYFPLAALNFLFHPVMLQQNPYRPVEPQLPHLPLRAGPCAAFGVALNGHVPDDVLDSSALRPLMNALTEHSRSATAEFDELFGERA